MNTLAQLTAFFGWAVVLNISFLFFAGLLLVLMRPTITSIHSKMFDISEKDLRICYFNYLANYKVFTFIFILSPYLVLKIIGS